METTTLLSIIAITVSACSFAAHFIKCNREEAKKGSEPKIDYDHLNNQIKAINGDISLINQRLKLHNIALNSHTTKLNQLTKAKQPTKTTAKKK